MAAVMIMAGGTGGHIFPALALAHKLQERGWKVVWLGARGGMETRLVPQYGFTVETVRIAGVRGHGVKRWLMLPFMMVIACIKTAGIIFRYRPDIAVGFGGYTGFPGGIMSRVFCIPLVIHEQNSVAGLTNRMLAPLASRTLFAFPGVFPGKDGLVGNPVRANIAAMAGPVERFSARQGPLNVLVVGGSLGAKVFNDTVPDAVALLSTLVRPRITHQAGLTQIDALKAHYRRVGVNAECVAFIDDMAAYYAVADLVICRAGALTVAELAAVGVGSVLVPFPYAVDDHQSSNAKYLTDVGAAHLITQQQWSAEKLAQFLGQLTRAQCLAMACQARRLALPDATDRVANECEALIGKQ